MATSTANLPYDTSTASNYKAIMQQFGTALTAFSWVQVMDTGTVSWAGVSTLPGNGVFRDWEIWRMADTAQGTTPVFMKLEYTTAGTNAPEIRVTIGTSSNGSGTITGTILLPAQTMNGQTTSLGAGNNFACYYSGASGRVMFLMYEGASASSAASPWTVGVERSTDATGAATTEFVVVTAIDYSNGTNILVKYMTTGGVVSGAETRLNAFTSSLNTNNFNGTTAACPQFALVGKLSNPLLNYALVPNGDAGEGATVTANVEGTTHTYICCKPSGTSFSNAGGQGGGTSALLCRYE